MGAASSPPRRGARSRRMPRSEEHTSELQSRRDLVCRLLLENKQINLTHDGKVAITGKYGDVPPPQPAETSPDPNPADAAPRPGAPAYGTRQCATRHPEQQSE